MKLGTVESLKFKKLKLKLGLAQWQAIGLLESLWMFTARNSPLGDIGRHSNEDIAVHLEWAGDADELIDTLVDCRWVDRSDEHRLLIHDWSDHLPMWLQGNLKRHNKSPIGGEPPKQATKQATKQPAKEPAKEPAQATCSEHPAIFSSLLISSPLTTSQLAEAASETFRTGYSREFEQWWEVFPVRIGKAAAWRNYEAAIEHIDRQPKRTDIDAHSWLLAITRIYADSPTGKGEFRTKPENWLADRRWEDDQAEWFIMKTKPGDKPKPKIPPLPKPQQPVPGMEFMK